MFNEGKKDSFADRLRTIRYSCSLTQDILSLAAGIDRSTLSYYESGRVFPSLSKLCLLAALFGISVDELIGQSEPTQLLLRDSGGADDEDQGEETNDEYRFGIPTSIASLKTEEQLLVLYFRQLLEKDRHNFLNTISEAAEEMQLQLIDPNDEDIILIDDFGDIHQEEE